MKTGNLIILGAGELASGVAVRLVRCGYRVVMTELPNPLAVRRLVSFSSAVHRKEASVEGVRGVLASLDCAAFVAGRVTVCIDPGATAPARLAPAAVIDGRMLKRSPGPVPGWRGPIIGLGPGFTAPGEAAFIVETHRGARLGEVITRGTAAPNTGVPGPVGGETARRVVYSPGAGRLEPLASIGDLVREGQVLGAVAGVPVKSPLTGLLRGLVDERAELQAGVKVADVDPRGGAVDPARISDKALAIGGGVLECLLRAGILPEDSGTWQQGPGFD